MGLPLPGYETASKKQAKGGLPTQWGNLGNLTELHISHQLSLEGTLPSQWAGMTSLKSLTLERMRKITGTLPSEWVGMSSLSSLRIRGLNKLGGRLPSEWSKMPATLKHLEVKGCQNMYGELPTQWGALSALTHLGIGALFCRNRAFGVKDVKDYPGDPCDSDTYGVKCGTLGDKLDHEDIRRKGTLPSEWANMKSLQHLALDHLRINFDASPSGENIPKEFGKLTDLKVL
jgi:hypothetical protein